MKKLVVFASGSGSNAENIHYYFQDKNIEIVAIFTNNAEAYVLERAKKLNIPAFVFSKEEFKDGRLLQKVSSFQPDLIVLAGFLWLIPKDFVTQFPHKIINIHPALLPNFGGKGMYGDNVHKAVVQSKATETGITIHYVNEHYDKGAIIFQEKCPVLPSDSYEDVAAKIHELEYKYFPKVIQKVLKKP